jgi:hypothetical protein
MESFSNDVGIYLSRRIGNDNEICFYKNSSFQPVLKADISLFIVISKYVITVASTYTENRGFLVSIFGFASNTKLKPLSKQYIDLFISDYEILNNGILFSGTSKDNKYNCVYFLKSQDLKISSILKVYKKKNDFLKIIKSDNYVLFYNSSLPGFNYNIIYTIAIHVLSGNIHRKVNSFSLKDKTLSFYGKGFYFKKRMYIPMINEQSDIVLANITIDDKTSRINNKYPMVTGLYKNLGIHGNYLLFIGYNYYKEKSSFYLVKYSLIKQENVFIKKLI